MTERESQIGVTGLAVVDLQGRWAGGLGVATDTRIRALVMDEEWRREALSRKISPVLLTDRRLIAIVNEVGDGTLVLFSEALTETVQQFITNVPFAFDIVDSILTDPYDAMVVVDSKGKVVFVSPVHEKFFGLRSGEAIGKNVRDVIENTRLHHVVKTGVAEIGQIQKMKGSERVVSRHPIRHDGKIVGAIGRVMFKGPQQLEAMSKRIRDLESEVAVYRNAAKTNDQGQEYLDAIIGDSPAIRSVREQIRKIAPLDISVLIEGESGTGKELVARALHMLSPRRDGRLVTVNAAALPDTLVESELFGYEAGSFTGADRKGRPGKFELADQGTIFLDEIGDMALETQSKLLRVLQDRMVERVGGEKPKRVDFRLISATNRDLQTFVDQGRFRLDLFYRISPIIISLPRLEDRLEDIPLLLAHFAAELARQFNRPVPRIDPGVPAYLTEQPWPGNVRQLRHVVERVFVFAEDGILKADDFRQLAAHQLSAGARQPAQPAGRAPGGGAGGTTLKENLDTLEAQLIRDAIIRFKGNKKKAAEHLGISRSYLYKKLEEGDPGH